MTIERRKKVFQKAYREEVTTCVSNEISHVDKPLYRAEQIKTVSLLMHNLDDVFITSDPRGLTLGLTILLIAVYNELTTKALKCE
jgi:hypothetical protein